MYQTETLWPQSPQNLRNFLWKRGADSLSQAAGINLNLDARDGLIAFTKETFPAYRPGAHHFLIAEALERIERGELRRLMIFMPPRHGKSELASIRLPAWYLGRQPQKQVICCSYSGDLAQTFSRAVRDTIASERFQAVFPDVRLDRRSKSVARWTLAGKENKRLTFIAAGVGGAITGEGANLLVIDDPIKNAEEAESEVYRKRHWEWYTSTALTRLAPGGAVLLIMTRWHQMDLAGQLLKLAKDDPEADQWEILHLPAIDDEGKALWPEMYDLPMLEAVKRALGRRFSALYQGKPVAEEGAMFNRVWFDIVEPDTVPEHNMKRVVRRWDFAATKDGGDWTVGLKMGTDKHGNYYIYDVRRIRGTPQETERLVRHTAEMDTRRVMVRAEQEPGSSGLQVMDTYRRRILKGWAFKGVPSSGDKALRAEPLSSMSEAGNVRLVRGEWNNEFLEELEHFPFAAHDDQVDAASGAFYDLTKSNRTATSHDY